MNKIPAEILANCSAENCLQNEIIILPSDGDAGFEEYVNYKAEEIRKKKHLFIDKKKTILLLSYPSPPEEKGDKRYSETLFERFFESPSILASNQVYQGCFGIDVSSYISDTANEKFLDLMSFIRKTPETTYILFVYTNNVNEAESMITSVNQYADFTPVIFSLPEASHLAKYICDRLRDNNIQVDRFVEEYLSEVLKDLSLGYDSAEYIVKILNTRNYNGTQDEARALIPEIISNLGISTRHDSFGY